MFVFGDYNLAKIEAGLIGGFHIEINLARVHLAYAALIDFQNRGHLVLLKSLSKQRFDLPRQFRSHSR